MDFVFNELSLEREGFDVAEFRFGIERIMRMRRLLKGFGKELYCHRNITGNLLARGIKIYNIKEWDINKKRAVLGWFDKNGPFWEDIRKHGEDDYLTYQDSIVTDTAIGEVAFLCLLGLDWRLVGLSPSAWDFSPISVDWYRGNDKMSVDVLNYWDVDPLQLALEEDTEAIDSWDDLRLSVSRFSSLSFSTICFDYLQDYPFSSSQAQRILMLLSVLQKYKNCFDRSGHLTDEGHRLRTNYFMGDSAWFSDSSDTEKSKFKKELTFPHPEMKGETIFCPMHGKVRGSQVTIRIHFSWPIRADEPLYVVYVGPKLTKR